MGKVFDALRRAEEERKASTAGAGGNPPASAQSAIPEARPVPAPVADVDAPPPALPPHRRRVVSRAPLGIGGAFRTAWRWIRNRGRLEVDAGLADVKRRIIQFDPYSPAAVRGAAGLQFAVPVAAIDTLPDTDRPLVALDPEGIDALLGL